MYLIWRRGWIYIWLNQSILYSRHVFWSKSCTKNLTGNDIMSGKICFKVLLWFFQYNLIITLNCKYIFLDIQWGFFISRCKKKYIIFFALESSINNKSLFRTSAGQILSMSLGTGVHYFYIFPLCMLLNIKTLG